MLRDRIWSEYSSEGKLKAQGIFDALQKIYAGLTTEDVADYVKTVHGFEGEDIETVSHLLFSFRLVRSNSRLITILTISTPRKETMALL